MQPVAATVCLPMAVTITGGLNPSTMWNGFPSEKPSKALSNRLSGGHRSLWPMYKQTSLFLSLCHILVPKTCVTIRRKYWGFVRAANLPWLKRPHLGQIKRSKETPVVPFILKVCSDCRHGFQRSSRSEVQKIARNSISQPGNRSGCSKELMLLGVCWWSAPRTLEFSWGGLLNRGSKSWRCDALHCLKTCGVLASTKFV